MRTVDEQAMFNVPHSEFMQIMVNVIQDTYNVHEETAKIVASIAWDKHFMINSTINTYNAIYNSLMSVWKFENQARVSTERIMNMLVVAGH